MIQRRTTVERPSNRSRIVVVPKHFFSDLCETAALTPADPTVIPNLMGRIYYHFYAPPLIGGALSDDAV